MIEMNEKIKRYESELTTEQLIQELRGESRVKEIELDYEVNFKEVDIELNRYIHNPKIKQKELDKFLVEPLHMALKHIPVNVLLDMRIWHWLCVKRFPGIVFARWVNRESVPKQGFTPDENIVIDQKKRFLGKRSLSGRSHNALSRIYFATHSLFDETKGYKYAKSAFDKQDFHTSIFDREFGLLPTVAKYVIKFCAEEKILDAKGIQTITKRVNHLGSTLILDELNYPTFKKLLK